MSGWLIPHGTTPNFANRSACGLNAWSADAGVRCGRTTFLKTESGGESSKIMFKLGRRNLRLRKWEVANITLVIERLRARSQSDSKMSRTAAKVNVPPSLI